MSDDLTDFYQKKTEKFVFDIPMVWQEQKDRCTDFCLVKTLGFNEKNKSKIEYPSLSSAIRPMPHSVEIPAPVFEQLPPVEDLIDVEECDDNSDADFEIL